MIEMLQVDNYLFIEAKYLQNLQIIWCTWDIKAAANILEFMQKI